MANFERQLHWQTFIPDLGNNRQLVADQLKIEVAVGMTKREVRQFIKAASLLASIDFAPEKKEDPQTSAPAPAREDVEAMAFDKCAELLDREWSPFVRMGPGTHSINGRTITTLRDYLRAVLEQEGIFNFIELQHEVMRLNSVDGSRALFFDAPSGGSSSTARPQGESVKSQTGAR